MTRTVTRYRYQFRCHMFAVLSVPDGTVNAEAAKRVRRQERKAARKKVRAEQKKAAKAAAKAAGGSDADTGSGSGSDSDSGGSDSDSDSDSDGGSESGSDDDVREKDTAGAEGQELRRFTTKTKMSVRNLRIREDTAKYLRNLDVNSAYYDPKTRSMRQNPTPNMPIEDVTFAGDNFVRHSGESTDVLNTQLFAWEQYNQGSELHAQAMPTQVCVRGRACQWLSLPDVCVRPGD